VDEIPFTFLRKLVSEPRIIKSLRPSSQKKVHGTALTIRVTDASLKAQLKAIDAAKPGDVVVAVAESMYAVVWDPFLSMLAEKKHLAGAVIDGVAEKDDSFPVYAREFVEFDPFKEHAIDTRYRGSPPDFSPIEIDNCRIECGDVLVGEGNEIIVVSRWNADEVVDRYSRIEKIEKKSGRMKALDRKDMELLSHISRDSRAKLEDISKALGLSSGAVAYRMKKLEEKGIIKGYTVELDLGSLGFDEPFYGSVVSARRDRGRCGKDRLYKAGRGSLYGGNG